MRIKYYLLLIFTGIIISSCDPGNPPNPNEQEVVTSLQITCTSPTDTVHFGYSDPDGNGGNPPTIDTAFLQPFNVYNVSLELLDETKTPIDTITNEIQQDAESHQFFFTVVGANLSNNYDDLDSSGYPVGLINAWNTFGVSTGTVMITLRHELIKSNPNVSSGDLTNAQGDTDVEIIFQVVIL